MRGSRYAEKRRQGLVPHQYTGRVNWSHYPAPQRPMEWSGRFHRWPEGYTRHNY